VPAKKSAKPRSIASLKREIAALRSTLDNVWAVLVDIDEANTQEEAVDAIYKACEVMAADWPDDFEITDEVSSRVQEQIDLEERFNVLAEKAEATEDWGQRAIFFREALAIQFGVDEQYIERQIEQLSPQDYLEIVSRYLWLVGALTAKAPINYREVADRLIKTLKEYKKTLPRKHGPEGSPIVTEALKIREKEKKPYRDIYNQLLPKYGEQMINKNLTPKILGERVRSRRSRLRKSKKASSQ
jgi:hypothetical protein